jgi:hypothetical protein
VVAAQVCRAVQGADERGQVLGQRRNLTIPGRPLVIPLIIAHAASLGPCPVRTLLHAPATEHRILWAPSATQRNEQRFGGRSVRLILDIGQSADA